MPTEREKRDRIKAHQQRDASGYFGGLLGRVRDALKGRGSKIDSAVDKASGKKKKKKK